MKEKKLTDEEIAKAILQSIEYSKTITYFDEWGNCKAIMMTDILDLIHRLQDENNQIKSNKFASWKLKFFNLKDELKKELAEHEEFTKKAKAEIERLKKEHERIAWSKQQYLDWVHGFLATHTDMKDRGEDYKMFDREWMCGVFWAKIEGSIEYIIDLENQRDELQKQVDELKETLKLRNIQLEDLRKYDKEIVKDTAKEILQEIWEEEFEIDVDIDEKSKADVMKVGEAVLTEIHNKIKEIAKRKGVEVE